mgnify:CR=1 FL=1
MASGKRYTIDEFKIKLSDVNSNIEILSDVYVNNRTPLKCKCKVCNNMWEAKPQHLLRGHGCLKCHLNKISLSINDIQNKVEDVIIIGKNNNKLNCKCEICGYEWNTYKNCILQNHKCPRCAIKRRALTDEEFINRLDKINKDVILLEKYNGMNNKVNVRCKICGKEYKVTPNNLLKGNKCKNCLKIKRTYKKEEIENKLDKISIIGEYKNTHTKTLFECNKCKHQWSALPSSILYGTGCPNCCLSKGEKYIKQFLEDKNIIFEQQKRFLDLFYKNYKNKLSYDFYLPDYNLLIEYNGKQHYQPINRFGGEESFIEQQNRDKLKIQYAKDKNLNLLIIKYDEDIKEKLKEYI